MNAGLLIASFFLGQGSIFAAQSWLVTRGSLDLLAQFGAHFSFLILALMVVDWGTAVVLARRISLAVEGELRDEVRRSYWSACGVRLCAVVAVAIVCTVYAWSWGDVFSRWYLLGAAPALAFWSFNATGILDGVKLSGVSGLTAMPAYVASAVALVLSDAFVSQSNGLLLGFAASFGYAVSVTAQMAVLYRVGLFPSAPLGDRQRSRSMAREGAAVLFSMLPGQASFRFQIVICALVLGPAVTGLFLYGRQVAVAASQVLEFCRRASFAALVVDVRHSETPVATAFRTQRTATVLALGLSSGLLVAGVCGTFLLDGPLTQACHVLALFSIGILSGSLSQTVVQTAQARGDYRAVAIAANAAMAVGLGATALFGALFHLPGLAASEVLTHVVVVLLLVLTAFRQTLPPARSRVAA
ncbi:hypothetical protein ASE04_20615 [Rhizobium sp. Root708]|nr:hypothetical protein ASE04_20615 [Rhizobium sp. Root708]